MTVVYNKIMLFPHVRLQNDDAKPLPEFFGDALLLVLEEGLVLPEGVTAVKPDLAIMQELDHDYAGLKKFGERALSENALPKDYIETDLDAPPLYDSETPTGILSSFRAGQAAQKNRKGINPVLRAAGLTLLLTEDVAGLNREASAVLKSANDHSNAMWAELKGGYDPMQSQTRDINLNLVDKGLVKKRLTAWGILAKMHALDFEAFVTLDRDSFEQCLSVFNPGAPIREVGAEGFRAVFYRLPVKQSDFLDFLINPDADYAQNLQECTVLGFVEPY